MYSVSQVIEQLLATNTKNDLNESETICECSIGTLKYNSVTDFKYEAGGQCSKKVICHFVATEKHKARISTKHFLRHREYNDKRKANQKNLKKKSNLIKVQPKNPQKNLLEYLSK